MTETTATAEILKDLPKPKRSNKWARGALTRGFYSAVQAFDATNLSLIMLFPRTAKVLGLEKVTGGQDRLRERIAKWENKINENDIEPVKPNYLKSGVSFALFNVAYLAPIIALGLAAGLAGGPAAALITAGVVNTHATMGEAFVQTARRRKGGIADKEALDTAMEDEKFRRAAKINVGIRGGVCLAITFAAGPLARLLGGFTSGALSSLARTPVGALLTDQMVNAGHKNVIKSIHKPLGKLFSEVANHGPAIITAKVSAMTAFVRAATASIASRFERKDVEEEDNLTREHAAEQDNDPAQAVANSNESTVAAEGAPVKNGTSGQEPPAPKL